jgi:superfamily II DNA or RNA helicase
MTSSWLDMSARGVTREDAERQVRSAELITRMLNRRPGFVLADEVGMGKTYVTFGHIAIRADQERRFRALVVAPSSDLARKWGRDLLDFCEKPSVRRREIVDRIQPMIALSTDELTRRRRPGVVITTVSAIVGGLRAAPKWERAWLFEAAMHRSRRRSSTRARLARRFGIRAADRRSASGYPLFGLSLEDARPVAQRSLGPFLLEESRRSRSDFDDALRSARRELIRKALPRYDLLVLDEAHKLKNPSSRRFKYLEQVLAKRFGTMLFLTATPFQIDLSELAAVFRLLGAATGSGCDDLRTTLAQVVHLAENYRESIEQLQLRWSICPHESACLVSDGTALAADEAALHDVFIKAVSSRQALADEIVKVMLRERRDTGHRRERVGSLRPGLDKAEAERCGVEVRGAGKVVFAASVRLFHEMRRNGRPTFDPVVLQSLTSSYDAYQRSPVRTRATQGREPFLAALIDKLSAGSEHPKVAEVIEAIAAAADRGEKTIVFTERIETAQRLARGIGGRLAADTAAQEEGVERGASGRLDLLVDEFANRRSPMLLAWRDNLLHTYFPLVVREEELRHLTTRRELRPVISHALEESARGVSAKTARKRDIGAVVAAVERHVLDRATMSDEQRSYAEALISYGRDDSGSAGDEGTSAETRVGFDIDDARHLVMRIRGFWAHAVDPRVIAKLEPDLRTAMVFAVRGAMTREERATRVAILRALARRRAIDRASALDRAMGSKAWRDIRSRTERFVDLVLEHETHELRKLWIDALERTRGSVARVTGNEHEGERTERGRAFNTPFRPYVLVATSVSQEGLDFQRECSHVIHHDLSWNPATLEQRVGRVDRIHSRTARLRSEGVSAFVDIGVPTIAGTIDDRMWHVVSARRAWLDLCLGLEHDWDAGQLDDPTPPLGPRVAARLRIDLSLAAARDVREAKRTPQPSRTAVK